MALTTLLSPRRYQVQGYGLALPDNFSLVQLRNALSRAQAEVNRYCNIPKQPSQFDWRGGTMTDEQHQWKIINPLAYGVGARRVYLNAGPIKAVTSFILDLGKTYTVVITPSDGIYVNHMEQYVEIVSVNPTVVGFYPLAVNLGLYNPIARVSYTYGWDLSVVGDVLEAESPIAFWATYGNWSSVVDPIIRVAGVEVDPGDYTLDLNDGRVTFTGVTVGIGEEVTADYTYLCPDEIPQAIGLTATGLLGGARMAQRGMTGLQSIKVAEVALTAFQPSQMVTKNGATIPAEAATLLDTFVFGSAF
jgi:hypothetical protein